MGNACIAIASALVLGACVAPREGQFTCASPSPACPEGWYCRNDGRCYSTPERADGGDAGRLDAARVDGGRFDAGRFDGGRFDGGRFDASRFDGGTSPDAGRDGGPLECRTDDECDDGNTCTDDDCVAQRCVRVAHSRSCDDGDFCNGADQCSAGACSVHAGDACPGPCQAGACVACGGYGEACCDGNTCDGLRRCFLGTCTCEEGDCGASAICMFDECETCGEPGLPCCEDGSCNAPAVCGGRNCEMPLER